jgi:hypothetical protein
MEKNGVVFRPVVLCLCHVCDSQWTGSKSGKRNEKNVQNSELLGFWTLSIVRYSKELEKTAFGKLDLFPSSGGGERPTLLGPLERANLKYWTTHVSITTATKISGTRLCRKEVTDVDIKNKERELWLRSWNDELKESIENIREVYRYFGGTW